MLTVVCFKWNDPNYRYGLRYTAAHVNVLRSMVRRHLSMPHEFVCVTDDSRGIDDDIRIVPIWPDYRELGGTWTRVKMFAAEMRELLGERIVMMDLDCVVTGSLDPLFDSDADFITTLATNDASIYNTGFYMLRAGARRQVWDSFNPDLARRVVKRDGQWEQGWLSYVLGEGERVWTAADGVLAYNRDCYRGNGSALPAGARIVFFFGPYDPTRPEDQARSPWILDHWR